MCLTSNTVGQVRRLLRLNQTTEPVICMRGAADYWLINRPATTLRGAQIGSTIAYALVGSTKLIKKFLIGVLKWFAPLQQTSLQRQVEEPGRTRRSVRLQVRSFLLFGRIRI